MEINTNKNDENRSQVLTVDSEKVEWRGDGFVRYHCPKCSTRIKTQQQFGGRVSQCGICKSAILVPRSSATHAFEETKTASNIVKNTVKEVSKEEDDSWDLLTQLERGGTEIKEKVKPEKGHNFSQGENTDAKEDVKKGEMRNCPKCQKAASAMVARCSECGHSFLTKKPVKLEKITITDNKSWNPFKRLEQEIQEKAVNHLVGMVNHSIAKVAAVDEEEEGNFKLNGANKQQLLSAFVASIISAIIFGVIWVGLAWFTHREYRFIAALMGLTVGGSVYASVRSRQAIFGLLASGISLVGFLTAKMVLAAILMSWSHGLISSFAHGMEDDAVARHMSVVQAYSKPIAVWYEESLPMANGDLLANTYEEVEPLGDSQLDKSATQQALTKSNDLPEFKIWKMEIDAYKKNNSESEISTIVKNDAQIQAFIKDMGGYTHWTDVFGWIDILWVLVLVVSAYKVAGPN